tara:strand:- start:388 stop:711 length:324 start_codon:yes stop_codon:yes gene_type:complete
VKKILVLFAMVTVGCASTQSIGPDKYYHFAAGAATEVVGHQLDLTPTSAAFAIGFAKELYDYADYGRFDGKDLLATWLGGVVVNYIIKKINEEKIKKINRQNTTVLE